jgi:hypothetical protein
VRVEREQDEFVETIGFFDCGDSVGGERLPIPHGRDGYRIEIRADGGDKFAALAFREDADGRPAPDLAVALGYGRSAFFGDIAGERAADEIERAQRDDVRIEKEIAKEGFDGDERIGAPELEEDDADAFLGLGSHRFRRDSLSWACFAVQHWWTERPASEGKPYFARGKEFFRRSSSARRLAVRLAMVR